MNIIDTHPTNEEKLLVYKALNFTQNTSFYLWTSLGLFIATILAGKAYFSNEMLKGIINESLVHGLFLLMALPVGLLLWRYAINKKERNIFLDNVYHKIGDTNTNKDLLVSLSKSYSRTSFSILKKIKIFFTYVGFLELYLTIGQFASTSKTVHVTSQGLTLLGILFFLIVILNFTGNKLFLKTISKIEA